MTDRHTAYLVTLDEPIREDDAKPVLDAIRQIRGVAAVVPVIHDLLTEQAATARRDVAWSEALARLITAGPPEGDH